jgi:hypothetical protein
MRITANIEVYDKTKLSYCIGLEVVDLLESTIKTAIHTKLKTTGKTIKEDQLKYKEENRLAIYWVEFKND